MKPFFSIIIPTLNEAQYLPKLLDSLCRQTFRTFEVLVVDAKSEDNTATVAQKYIRKLPSLTVILCEEKNLPLQRNKGAKIAKGTYFIFFDADVSPPENFLEVIYQTIQQKKSDFLTTWFEADSDNSSDKAVISTLNIGLEIGKVIDRPLCHGPNTIVSKKVFKQVGGFDESLKMGEDYDFTLRVFKAGYDLVILKEPRLVMSMRRYRAEGRLTVLSKLSLASLHMILLGPVTSELFNYHMGGHVHKGKKKLNIAKLDQYMFQIEKLQKRISGMLSE